MISEFRSGSSSSATDEELDRSERIHKEFSALCAVEVPTFEAIETRIEELDGDERCDVLVNLVVAHLRATWQHGRGLFVEEYCERFGGQSSAFSSIVTVPVEIIATEFVSRHEFPNEKGLPELGEYSNRFGKRRDVLREIEASMLDRRYVRIRRIGYGGLGQVWHAYDRHLRRSVAIKEPKLTSDFDEQFERLAREARLTARLEHPGIIAVHEFAHPSNRTPFYVMRLINGVTLREMIAGFYEGGGQPTASVLRSAPLLPAFLEVCAAIGYAHHQGVIHSDLKPDNILVRGFSESVVLDWGGAVGTVAYMAPESPDGEVSAATDVFGLGAILYEVLTGSPPYDRQSAEKTSNLLRRVRDAKYTAPRSVNSKIPKPLDAICVRAMAKGPTDRYTAADDLASDVRSWLADQPVVAYRDRPLERFERLIRHNVGVSISVAVFLLGILGAWSAWRSHTAVLAETRLRENRRETLIQEAQRIQLLAHTDGWSHEVNDRLSVARTIRPDESLRDIRASGLIGLDAERETLTDEPGSFLCYGPGNSLLVGGSGQSPAKIWDPASEMFSSSNIRGPAAVGFSDGMPLVLSTQSSWLYQVVNAATNEIVQRLEIPHDDSKSEVRQLLPALSISPDGRYAGASPILPGDKGVVAIWDLQTGDLLHEFDEKAHGQAIVFDRNSKFVAIGTENGEVIVWSTKDGTEKLRVSSDNVGLHRLAFGNRAGGLLLAAGDAGGTITVWDVEKQIPRSYCRGSKHHIYGLAFNVDSTVLGSCGRGDIRLWNPDSGSELIRLRSSNTMHDLAFSLDGRQLAYTGSVDHGGPPGVHVWNMSNGRGIRTLRGLSGGISKVALSPNEEIVLAVSHSWKVGVWSANSGELLNVIEPRPGFFVDNVDVVVNADGTLLAFSAGTEASLWEIPSGNRIWAKELPPGLCDQLAFTPSGRLLLFRCETLSGEVGPFSTAHPKEHPRVCRLRDLLAEEYQRPIREIDEFNWHVFNSAKTSDGRFFAAEGTHVSANVKRRTVQVYEGETGSVHWTLETENPNQSASFCIDPNNDIGLVYSLRGENTATLVSLENKTVGRTLSRNYRTISILGGVASARLSQEDCDTLFDLGSEAALVTLGKGIPSIDYNACFSRDGRRFVWGAEDGRVFLGDIPLIRVEAGL